MYGIEVVEVLSISVQERVMIGYGDGRTHVFCQLGLEVKWFSHIVDCVGCVLCWTRGNFCISKYDSV